MPTTRTAAGTFPMPATTSDEALSARAKSFIADRSAIPSPLKSYEIVSALTDNVLLSIRATTPHAAVSLALADRVTRYLLRRDLIAREAQS